MTGLNLAHCVHLALLEPLTDLQVGVHKCTHRGAGPSILPAGRGQTYCQPPHALQTNACALPHKALSQSASRQVRCHCAPMLMLILECRSEQPQYAPLTKKHPILCEQAANLLTITWPK